MSRKLKWSLLLAFPLGFIGLIALIDWGRSGFMCEKKLNGKYVLFACSCIDQLSVWQGTDSTNLIAELIPPTVFAVGWDGHFIIAKRHPKLDTNPWIDRTITHYYILRVQDGHVTGPLDVSAFTVERKKQGVPTGLDFTEVYHNLQ